MESLRQPRACGRAAIGKIRVGRGPIQVYATPNGREVYVANEGTRAIRRSLIG